MNSAPQTAHRLAARRWNRAVSSSLSSGSKMCIRDRVHECCNYDGGNCIALDDGEECVCVQSISYSLLCRWFRAAVLPLDRELETALLRIEEIE